MKFDKPKAHRQWTSEETKARINLVNSEISSFSRDLNLLDSVIATLRHRKESIQQKISNKVKYVNQLEKQLEEIIVEDVEKMLIEYNDATEPDIVDELRPWSASGSLSPYFRFVPTTTKDFEGNPNPTGSNSYYFNVQPLKLESSDIKPEIEVKSTTTKIDAESLATYFLQKWFKK